MIGIRNLNSVLCLVRSEAQETAEQRARSILNAEYRSLRVADYKASRSRYLDYDQL